MHFGDLFMSSVFLCLLFLYFSGTNGECYVPSSNNGPFDKPLPAKRDLNYCYWYNELTCCTHGSSVQSSLGKEICNNISSDCQDQWNLFLCRYCTPLYSEFVDYQNKFRVCGKFADKLYDSCKSSEILYNGQCSVVQSQWGNGKDFIQNVFDKYYVEDNLNCFNSSPSMTFQSLTLFVSSLFVLFCIFLFH